MEMAQFEINVEFFAAEAASHMSPLLVGSGFSREQLQTEPLPKEYHEH
jgi:hypothetical protein